MIALKSSGADISLESALEHFQKYRLGLDMTRRDLQGEGPKNLADPGRLENPLKNLLQ